MSILLLFVLSGILATSAVMFFMPPQQKVIVPLAQGFMLLTLIIVLGFSFVSQPAFHYSLSILSFQQHTLTLAITMDGLSKLMMIYILLIGFIIHRYGQNYLESDNTRLRFLAQLNLVLLSVLLLVMSANLLTAFVAWQFIGINLYLLLNHYHYDANANRAAKKKFVINRIGDASFLMALVLAYQTQSAESFTTLASSSHAELIGILLFLSVMTKCAQFPFHIWLLDTMGTPTPVSALMHAGIINAGGLLLTRLSGIFVNFHFLAYGVLLIGLLSALLSVHWMNQQPDTKKKLAYSTMGQMGYMLIQCGLGAFAAAIFHLISHGFYKASLFLNAGETLGRESMASTKVSYLVMAKGFIITLLMLAVGLFLFQAHVTRLPILVYGFMFYTLWNLNLKIDSLTNKTLSSQIGSQIILHGLIGFIFLVYLLLFFSLTGLLSEYEYQTPIANSIQIMILGGLFLLQLLLWRNPEFLKFPKALLTDGTERFLRQFFLNPLRAVGELINIPHYKPVIKKIYVVTFYLISTVFVLGLLYFFGITAFSFGKSTPYLTLALLLIANIALVFANRCQSINGLLYYLVLFELAFVNIALVDGHANMAKLALFHFVNVAAVIAILKMLAKDYNQEHSFNQNNNRLPSRVFYLVFSLLLLIGLPGSASFISEFYLLNALMQQNLLMVFMYMSLIVLVSVVIMHSLQLYAFNKHYSSILLKPITLKQHVIILAVISFNVSCGVFPGLFLK